MDIDAGSFDRDVALNAIAVEVASHKNDINGFPCIHCEIRMILMVFRVSIVK